jgi:quercetin dioxygenase-like cupin family protein
MVGDSIAVLHGAVASGGRFEFFLAHAWPGGGPPLHTHPEAETFYVLDGQFEFSSYFDGELKSAICGPGDTACIPGAVPHTFRCLDGGEGRCAIFVTPAGRDGFFREAGRPANAGNIEALRAEPVDFPRLLEIAGRHNLALWDAQQAWDGASARVTRGAEAARSSLRLAGEIAHVQELYDDAGGGLMLLDTLSLPGGMVPVHAHEDQEVMYVVEGEYEFSTRDDNGAELSFRAPAGTAVFIPSWAWHGFRSLGDKPGRMLACFNGTQHLSFFREAGKAADREAAIAAGFTLDMDELQEIVEVAKRNGIRF